MTEKDLTIYSVTVTGSFKIRKSFVSAWTLSCFLLLLNSQKDNVYWILAQEPAFFPFCYVQKTQAASYEALEIQEESADMARRSIAYNHLEDKIHVTTGDIRNTSEIYGKQSFDAVVTNPPYMTDTHGLKNPDMPKAIARHEVLCTLEDVIRESAAVLKPKRSFFMVHRPFRLAEIMQTMSKYHLEPKRMCLVHPYIDKEPNMVLIEGVKDGRSRITVEPPIIVYKSPNVYTDQLLKLYGYQ